MVIMVIHSKMATYSYTPSIASLKALPRACNLRECFHYECLYHSLNINSNDFLPCKEEKKVGEDKIQIDTK